MPDAAHPGTRGLRGTASLLMLLGSLGLPACGPAAPTPPGWERAFRDGEQAGAALGRDLEAAVAASEALEPGARTAWFAGYAHRAPWDVANPTAQLAAIEAQVPESHRPALITGVLLRHSITHGGDPTPVVPFALDVSWRTGISPIDGVRIGLQMSQGHDMPAALALAGRYPPDWQPAMHEELGWRLGDDGELGEIGQVRGLLARIPDPSRAPFVHGVCRGGWRAGEPTADVHTLLQAVAPAEADACIDALAFAAAQSADPAHRERLVAALAGAAWGPTLARALERSDAANEEDGMTAHDGARPDLQGFGLPAGGPVGETPRAGPARPAPPSPQDGRGPPPGPLAPPPRPGGATG